MKETLKFIGKAFGILLFGDFLTVAIISWVLLWFEISNMSPWAAIGTFMLQVLISATLVGIFVLFGLAAHCDEIDRPTEKGGVRE